MRRYRGLHIEFTGVDEAPLTLYAEPQGPAKLASEGIERAGEKLAIAGALEQRYRDGKMPEDSVFKSAPFTQKALPGPLAAASTYQALFHALGPQAFAPLRPITLAAYASRRT